MKFHREGRKIITFVFILTAISVVAFNNITIYPVLALAIVIPVFAILLLVLWFFRIPDRPFPKDDNLVVAPADGKVVVLEKTTEKEYLKDERIQISIFMSPLNIHQNVYPVAGEVSYTKYHKGKYLVAWHPKSSTENERATVVVKTKNGVDVLFRQIAGALARRICTYAKPGDSAEKGGEFGFIKFGSRVDVFLPLNAKILCKVGDVTKNKITPLAEL